MIKITQIRSKCVGCVYCVMIAPERWFTDESDGKCTMYDATEKNGIFTVITTDDEYRKSLDIVRTCPVKIVQVEQVK